MKQDLNEMIFGKNSLGRVVSVEPKDDICEVFIESKSGEIISKKLPNRFFVLTNYPDGDCKELKGTQFFRYAQSFRSRMAWREKTNELQSQRREYYCVRDPKESFMIRYGVTYFKDIDLNEVSILSVDTEDTFGIGDEPDENGRMLLIANTYEHNGKIVKTQFSYDDYKSEREMLKAWAAHVVKLNPSIVIGHNVFGHDLKVINFAARRAKLKLHLGRDGSEMQVADRDSQFRVDGSQSYSYRNILIYGREIVDTWFLAMKYDKASSRYYDNYKLKYIVAFEGLEKKSRVHYDASKIKQNYKIPSEWAKIKAYNKDDADDPLAYFKLVAPVFFYYNRMVPRSFQSIVNSATGSQINSLMVRSYLQLGHSIPKANDAVHFQGAISFGIPGINSNVFKIDVQSLYPSIILSKKLYDKKKDPYGHSLKILDYMTSERIVNKEKYEQTKDKRYKGLSDSQKVVCNSMYGFYGANRLNYNSPGIAEETTRIGRKIITKGTKWCVGDARIPTNIAGYDKLQARLDKLPLPPNYHDFVIVNGDTDSISFRKQSSKKFDEVEQAALLKEVNALMPERIEWKNDKHFDKFIVVAAKNYIMKTKKEIKIKGAALRATRKEPFLKDFLNEVIECLLKNKLDTIHFVYMKYVRIIQKLAMTDDLSPYVFKQTISPKVLDNSDESTVFNKKVLKAILDSKIEFREGDKVSMYYDPKGKLRVYESGRKGVKLKPMDKRVLLRKLMATIKTFNLIIDVRLFPNFSLKRNAKLLESL